MRKDNDVTIEDQGVCRLIDLVEGQMFTKLAGEVVYMFGGLSSSLDKYLYISLGKGYRNWMSKFDAERTKVRPIKVGYTVKIVQR